MMIAAKQTDLSQPLATDGTLSPMKVAPTDTLRRVAARMAESKLTRFPVLNAEGKFVGIITIDDLLLARSKETLRESNRTQVLRLRWPFGGSREGVVGIVEGVEALDAEREGPSGA
jgi:CBS domain-containing protein